MSCVIRWTPRVPFIRENSHFPDIYLELIEKNRLGSILMWLAVDGFVIGFCSMYRNISHIAHLAHALSDLHSSHIVGTSVCVYASPRNVKQFNSVLCFFFSFFSLPLKMPYKSTARAFYAFAVVMYFFPRCLMCIYVKRFVSFDLINIIFVHMWW